MILEFDTNPLLTPEEKLLSLKESVQRALEEDASNSEKLYKSLLNALGVESASLKNNFASLSERLEAEAQSLSEALADVVARLEAVEVIAGEVASINSRLSAAELTITTLQNNYTLLEARVTALENE